MSLIVTVVVFDVKAMRKLLDMSSAKDDGIAAGVDGDVEKIADSIVMAMSGIISIIKKPIGACATLKSVQKSLLHICDRLTNGGLCAGNVPYSVSNNGIMIIVSNINHGAVPVEVKTNVIVNIELIEACGSADLHPPQPKDGKHVHAVAPIDANGNCADGGQAVPLILSNSMDRLGKLNEDECGDTAMAILDVISPDVGLTVVGHDVLVGEHCTLRKANGAVKHAIIKDPKIPLEAKNGAGPECV